MSGSLHFLQLAKRWGMNVKRMSSRVRSSSIRANEYGLKKTDKDKVTQPEHTNTT